MPHHPYPSAAERQQRLVAHETFRCLAHWAPLWKRASDEVGALQAVLTATNQSHAEWLVPDMRQVATHVIVLAGLASIALIDALLISAVGEYVALTFFPNRPLMVMVVRIIVPMLLVGADITIAVFIASAKEYVVWDGSRPDYRYYSKVGWAMIAVTPLMVIATMLAGAEHMTVGLVILAVAQTLLGGLLHAAIVKGGQWIREAIGFALFHARRQALTLQIRTKQRFNDRAAEQVRIAYPAWHVARQCCGDADPDNASTNTYLPSDVKAAIEQLFGGTSATQQQLPQASPQSEHVSECL